MKKQIKSPELSIELDSEQIFPNDPGAGTPALVVKKINRREFTASFWCATDTGELDCGGYQLTESESAWLEEQRENVEAFIAKFQA